MPDAASRRLRSAALRVWLVLYSWGYMGLAGATFALLRPAYGIRTVGRRPRLPRGGFLVCANHASYLDPAFVQLSLPRRVVFMMTSDWYRRPAVGWFFRLVAAVPIDPGRLAHQGMRQGIDLLRRGRLLGVFPEGRLSRDGAVGAGQRGIAILARMASAPVLPVGIAGNFGAWPRGSRRPRRADVRLSFGPLIRWTQPGAEHERDDEQAFVDRVMSEVARARSRAEGAPPRPARRARG